MADEIRKVKRNVKDTVFSKLFEDPENQLALYQFLHPEDASVTVDDFKTVTIENVLLDQMYNDLGFTVRNRLLLLTEAQSTWSLNIIPRILMYYGESLNDYIHSTEQNVYRRRKIRIPKPEFYVIYTGTGKNEVEKIYTLAEEYFGGDDSFINIKVRILQAADNNSIVTQYIRFTQILAEQERIHKRVPEAIRQTIKVCKDKDILKKFFEEHEQEVIDIMATLYKDEELNKAYERDRDIQIIIGAYRDAKLTDDQIMEYIMKRFNLNKEDAEDYLAPVLA